MLLHSSKRSIFSASFEDPSAVLKKVPWINFVRSILYSVQVYLTSAHTLYCLGVTQALFSLQSSTMGLESKVLLRACVFTSRRWERRGENTHHMHTLPTEAVAGHVEMGKNSPPLTFYPGPATIQKQDKACIVSMSPCLTQSKLFLQLSGTTSHAAARVQGRHQARLEHLIVLLFLVQAPSRRLICLLLGGRVARLRDGHLWFTTAVVLDVEENWGSFQACCASCFSALLLPLVQWPPP